MTIYTNTRNKLLALVVVSSLYGFSSSVQAEDTEAFFNVTASAPNILFLLDSSEGMSLNLAGKANPGPSRLSILQEAMRVVFNTKSIVAPENINVGLMRFGPSSDEVKCLGPGVKKNDVCYDQEAYRDYGVHGISLPISPIDDPASNAVDGNSSIDNLPPLDNSSVRGYIPTISDTWVAQGSKPIVDALYEGALYFRGEKMRWGQDIPSSQIAAHPASYAGPAITQNRKKNGIKPATAPLYKSPVQSECQSNYMVLMTDGIPTYFNDINAQGLHGAAIGPAGGTIFGDANYGALAAAVGIIDSQSGDGNRGGVNPKGFRSGSGGYELVRYISQNDNFPDIEGEQPINTFVVSLGPTITSNEREYLETLASVDDPDTANVVEGYYSALNGAELAAAFTDILDVITQRAISYASPGYSVNVKSGLEHEREVYVPMFDRRNASVWPGNLKKFKINEVSGKRVIQDKNDVNATDELGAITATAIDLWSTSTTADPDGTDVQRGGLANLLPLADERNVLSDFACTGGNCVLTGLTETQAQNGGITDTLLGTATADERVTLIAFIRGKNADGSQRYHMGDMMHSEPIVITYKSDDSAEGEDSNKEQYIFVGTNEGYLHAFDTDTGEEKFAFMPQLLLKNIKPQFEGLSASDHTYGIDGGITFWEDKDNDKKYLYFGLRRGGRAYYALDVTNIDIPKLLWSKSDLDSDYANLGQTWSIPYLAKVGVDGETCQSGLADCKEVLIVSGGYDKAEDRDIENTLKLDDATKPVLTSMGNDIFIIDALTGDRIWSLQSDTSIDNKADLLSSVPGGLRMLDTNYNTLVDRLYFADTAGYVWRLDLSEKIGDTARPSTLTEFADLGDVDSADARKFYNEPDVSAMKLNGKSVFVVSIGSGFRPHPLDKTLSDKLYILLDKSPYGEPDDTAILDSNLAKITISGIAGATTVSQPDGTISDTTKNFKGWEVALPEDGEKSMSAALVFDGVVTFTTLIPEENIDNIDECDPPSTHGRFYGINILTGEAGLDLNGDGVITDADLTMDVVSGDIPGTPQSVFNPLGVADKLDAEGNPTGTKTCTHPVDIRIGKKLSQATGYDACRLESVYWTDPVVQ